MAPKAKGVCAKGLSAHRLKGAADKILAAIPSAPESQAMRSYKDASEKNKRPCKRFQLPSFSKPSPAPLPRAAELAWWSKECIPVAPPDTVMVKIGDPSLVVGIDVETHDWDDEPAKPRLGRFGHFTYRSEHDLAYPRIVQIGWVIGEPRAHAPLLISKERFVKPWEFCVTERAIKFHGIADARLRAEGGLLDAVLREFLADVFGACRQGGRIVAHHLEFDAGIIAHELERSGLDYFQQEWAATVRQGTCTMDPEVCRWIRRCHGQESSGTQMTSNLKNLVHAMVPDSEQLLDRHHTAGADAQMHRLLYIAIHALAQEASRSTSRD